MSHHRARASYCLLPLAAAAAAQLVSDLSLKNRQISSAVCMSASEVRSITVPTKVSVHGPSLPPQRPAGHECLPPLMTHKVTFCIPPQLEEQLRVVFMPECDMFWNETTGIAVHWLRFRHCVV